MVKSKANQYVVDLSEVDDLGSLDVYVKLKKYAGSSRISVSPSATSASSNSVEAESVRTVT